MPALAPVPAANLPAAVQRIAGFMQNFSVEATRPSDADIAALTVLPRGTRVYISAVPHRPMDESINAAIRLRAVGLEPVPHIAVRNFASADALDDCLARLNGEAEVRRVLVIAGDRADHGPFRSAADAIDSGLFRRRGIRALGIAGYPEGHPKIGNDTLFKALTEKIAAAEATGLAVEIVTQFCFDARAILDYVARLRAFGFEQPLRIGLAGPTSLAGLLRYASRCGVRASAQALAQRSGMLRQMFALTVPDDLIRALADAAPSRASAHFFSFGGLPATARWAQAVADGRIALQGAGGFTVASPPRDG
ncbi:MAG: methylenetetrahydrofolate reductase [Xanthobacteraceae bacterium]